MPTAARGRKRRNESLKVLAILVVGVILTAEAFVKMAGRGGFTEFVQDPVVRVLLSVTDRFLGL